MFVPPYATRTEDVDWNAVLTNALRKVQLKPSPSVSNAVGMLDSYYHQSASTSSSSSPSDVPQVPEDAMQQCSFLLALDQAVAGWPSTLLLTLQPPSTAIDAHEIAVTRPYVEAVLVLYNAAVFYLKEGMADITRVRAEAVRLAMGAGQSVAPNVNAKKAYKSFTTAQALSQRADSLTRSAASGAMLDRTDVAHLTTYVNAHSLFEICRLCSAVAKYVCAVSSSSTSSKHGVLASLAYEAAAISLPSTIEPSLTVTLLPTVLLAVYHYHKAEKYYESTEMDAAVGHVVFADDLLRQVVTQVKKNQKFVQKTWDSILQSVKGKLGGSNGGNSPLVEFTVEEKDDDEVKESAELYTQLAKHVVGTDLVSLFPFFQSYLAKQLALLKKCLYENRVLYFARPWPAEKVRVDVPDVADNASDTAYKPTDADRQASALFSELPSASQVHERLVSQSKEEQRTRLTTERLLEVQRQESEVLLVSELPAEVAQALDDLEPCLRTDSSTIEGALNTAQAAIRSVTERFLAAVRDWQRRHPATQGVALDALPTCAAVKEAVEEWEGRSDDLHAAWEQEVGKGLTTREQIEATLFPSRAACLAFVDQTDQLVYRISQSMEHGEALDDLERTVAQHLAEGKRCVATARTTATTLVNRKLPLLKEIAKLLWDAPAVIEIISTSQDDLQKLEREMAAAAAAAAAAATQIDTPKPKAQATAASSTPANHKRSRSSSSVDSETFLTPVESLSRGSTPRASAKSPGDSATKKKAPAKKSTKKAAAPAPRSIKSKVEKTPSPKVEVKEEEDQEKEEEEKVEVTTATVSTSLLAKIRASRQNAAAAAAAAATTALHDPEEAEEKKEETPPKKKTAPKGKKSKAAVAASKTQKKK